MSIVFVLNLGNLAKVTRERKKRAKKYKQTEINTKNIVKKKKVAKIKQQQTWGGAKYCCAPIYANVVQLILQAIETKEQEKQLQKKRNVICYTSAEAIQYSHPNIT